MTTRIPTRIPIRGIAVTLLAAATAALPFAALAEGDGARQGMRHRGGDPLVGALMSLQSGLALDSSQQQQWSNALAATQAARQQGAALRASARATFDAEIAKPTPDLAAVAAAADQARSQGEALRKSVRDQWLAVYANLNPQQKTMVGQAIRDRVDAAHESHGAKKHAS